MIQQLDSRYTRDDTCATWSKQFNEEVNAKESRREEDSSCAIRETRGCQANQATAEQNFRHTK
jgi:hypothetical protein